MYIQPFPTVVDWPKNGCLMKVSTMLYICRYCIFTWDGRFVNAPMIFSLMVPPIVSLHQFTPDDTLYVCVHHIKHNSFLFQLYDDFSTTSINWNSMEVKMLCIIIIPSNRIFNHYETILFYLWIVLRKTNK